MMLKSRGEMRKVDVKPYCKKKRRHYLLAVVEMRGTPA